MYKAVGESGGAGAQASMKRVSINLRQERAYLKTYYDLVEQLLSCQTAYHAIINT